MKRKERAAIPKTEDEPILPTAETADEGWAGDGGREGRGSGVPRSRAGRETSDETPEGQGSGVPRSGAGRETADETPEGQGSGVPRSGAGRETSDETPEGQGSRVPRAGAGARPSAYVPGAIGETADEGVETADDSPLSDQEGNQDGRNRGRKAREGRKSSQPTKDSARKSHNRKGRESSDKPYYRKAVRELMPYLLALLLLLLLTQVAAGILWRGQERHLEELYQTYGEEYGQE